MKGFTRRLGAVAFGVTTAIIAVVTPGAVAGVLSEPAASPACSATAGVTVIVDFTHFGGQIERGCAPGHPADGLIALHDAGFTTAGTTQYGDAFVCRIDSLPSPKQDACAVTPPASAFWAFWNARPSATAWTFTSVGVLDYHPAAGSVEAFAFGKQAQPGIPPSDALPPTTTTRPTTTRATTPPTAPPPSTSTAPTTTAGVPVTAAAIAPHSPTTKPPVTSTTTKRATAHRPPHASSTTSRSATTTTRALPRVIERSAAGPSAHGSTGSPVPAILTVIVVGGLAIATFSLTRARRRRSA